jgi:hypothetical protein
LVRILEAERLQDLVVVGTPRVVERQVVGRDSDFGLDIDGLELLDKEIAQLLLGFLELLLRL